MSNDQEYRIHFTQSDDGSWLAASVSRPWFCVSAASEEAVRAEAQAALDFWVINRSKQLSTKLESNVAQFAVQHVESLRAPALAYG